MFLINAHGPDHGLSVEVEDGIVTIRQWAECPEPNENGSYSPHIQSVSVSLERLFADRPHHERGYVNTSSMHGKVVSLALHWLAYEDSDEEPVDDEDRPCQHFEMNYNGIGKRRTEPWPAHMTCSECGKKPE